MARFILFCVLVSASICTIYSKPEIVVNDSNPVQNSINKEITKSRTLFDYQARVVAYKDLIESRCLLGFIKGGETFVTQFSESHNVTKNFFMADSRMSKRQIWTIGGQRVVEFCRGFPTYLIHELKTDEDPNSILPEKSTPAARHKRDTKHFFVGRVRGQTQSQYLNFGNSNNSPGKAEAESTYGNSKAVVSGSSGMGQAQSQSAPVGCEECYGQEQILDYSKFRLPSGINEFPSGLRKPSYPARPGYPESSWKPLEPTGNLPRGDNPQKPAGPTQPTYPSQKPRYPTGSDQFPLTEYPSAPGLPARPGYPVQTPGYPALPGYPSSGGPGVPGLPVGPGYPTHSGTPGYPVLQQPGQPTQSSLPGGPGYPAKPRPSAQPGYPAYPGTPGYPVLQQPGQPTRPSLPVGPGYPAKPGPSAQPGYPTYPGTPGYPVLQQPGQPTRPSLPVGPGYPTIPGPSAQPGQPTQPSLPGGPGYPAKPGLGYPTQRPGVPGTPGHLIAPGYGQPGEPTRPSLPVGPEYPIKPGPLVQPGYPTQKPGVPITPGYQQPGQPTLPISPGYPTAKLPGYPASPGSGPESSTYPKLPQEPGYSVPGTLPPGYPVPGSTQPGYPAKPSTGYYPLKPGYAESPGSLSRQDLPRGRFSGHVSGDYQHESAHSGKFSGVFSGEYQTHPTLGIPSGQHYPIGPDGRLLEKAPDTTSSHGSPSITQPYVEGGRRPGYPGTATQNGYTESTGTTGQISYPGVGQVGYPEGQITYPRGPSQTGYPGAPIQEDYSGITGQDGYTGITDGRRQPSYPSTTGQVGYQRPTGQDGYTGITGPYPGAPGSYPGSPSSYPATTGQTGYPGSQTSYPASPGQFGYPDGEARYPAAGGQVGYPGQQAYPGTTGQIGYPGYPGAIGSLQQPGTGQQTTYPGQQPSYTGTPGEIHYPGSGTYPSQLLEDGSRIPSEGDDSNSQVQTSVQQIENETQASASAQGKHEGGTAQSQVSGTYSGSGGFSASAGSDDGKRGALTQISGGKEGAMSAAQGRGGWGQSQAQVQLASDTGDTISSAQTGGWNHGSQTQVQASGKGGMADSQANGPGSTSSQAQIGFTPYDENEPNNQTTPFRGGGVASAQSSGLSGQAQSQLQGKFNYGIRYVGSAQAGSGSKGYAPQSHNQTNPIAFTFPQYKPLNLTTIRTQRAKTQTQMMHTANTKKIEQIVPKPAETTSSTQGLINHDQDVEESATDDYNEEYEEYDEAPGSPKTKSIISQDSKHQRQHIILDPVENLDATVHQSYGGFPTDGTILEPGQIIPGSPGYKIPAGFRGKVRAISNGNKTYTTGRDSQAQSVALTPGTGRVIYKAPIYAVGSNTQYRSGVIGFGSGYTYHPIQYQLKSGKALPNFVSLTKSETGQRDLHTGKKTPSVSYTQSSSCGIFTNTCVFNNSGKLCFPRPQTNADGSFVAC